jgi:hypothetical protein
MAYKVAQSNPAANTPANLYTVPSAKEAVISTLAICNDGGPGSFTIRIRPAGATAAKVHLLASASLIGDAETVFITAGIALAASDVVTVEGSTANMVFTAFINEVSV